MDDAERLEGLEEALAELRELSSDRVLLVEGMKDEAALRAVGVDGEYYHVQSGGGPVRAAEHVWRRGSAAVILTDWDRRGDDLAQSLSENLTSLGVPYDAGVRRTISRLALPYCKDVESLDSVMVLLQNRSEEHLRAAASRRPVYRAPSSPGSPAMLPV